MAVIAVMTVLFLARFEFRRVIRRIPIPGTTAQVTFFEDKPLLGGTAEFQIDFGDGAITKDWLDSTQVTQEQIRSNCRVEYDGETLRITGPRPTDSVEVPGFRP